MQKGKQILQQLTKNHTNAKTRRNNRISPYPFPFTALYLISTKKSAAIYTFCDYVRVALFLDTAKEKNKSKNQ